jgi:hypothetical protein
MGTTMYPTVPVAKPEAEPFPVTAIPWRCRPTTSNDPGNDLTRVGHQCSMEGRPGRSGHYFQEGDKDV